VAAAATDDVVPTEPMLKASGTSLAKVNPPVAGKGDCADAIDELNENEKGALALAFEGAEPVKSVAAAAVMLFLDAEKAYAEGNDEPKLNDGIDDDADGAATAAVPAFEAGGAPKPLKVDAPAAA
jgi:hypothetical protein